MAFLVWSSGLLFVAGGLISSGNSQPTISTNLESKCCTSCAFMDREPQRQQPAEVSYRSCKELLETGNVTATGEYSIRTVQGRLLKKVYCEMGLNGGGYTFIHPMDLALLTNAEVQAMYTNRTSFLLRVIRNNGQQQYGILQQLDEYRRIPLKVELNGYGQYGAPDNTVYIRPGHFVYFAFLPNAARYDTLGLNVNGVRNTYQSGPVDQRSNANFMALFPNFKEATPTTAWFSHTSSPFCDRLFNALKVNPSHRLIPVDFFMFMEIHWTWGCYTQTDDRTSVGGITGAAIGFR